MFAGLAAGLLALAGAATIMAVASPYITLGAGVIMALGAAVAVLAVGLGYGLSLMAPFIDALAGLTMENAAALFSIGLPR